jgi:D-Tyr-tRNAtyr deacylase
MSNNQKGEDKIVDDNGRCSPANENANNDNKNNTTTNTSTSTTNISIRMVIQRYRKASLLIDEMDYVTVGEEEEEEESNCNNGQHHIGMLVYISFSKIATPDVVQRAAKTILNLPIQTEGAWGDGSSTKSILQVSAAAAAANVNEHADASNQKQQHQQQGKEVATSNNKTKNKNNVSIMLVPQANLIAKVTRNGKSVQYRDQIDKKQGEELYNLFVKYVKEILIENKQIITQQGSNTNTTTNEGNNNNNNNNAMTAVEPSILPKELFLCRQKQQQQKQKQNINTNTKTPLLYGSFDENTGLPLTTADGKPLTKSATKRIKKQYDAHTKRHEKYLLKLKQQQPIPTATTATATDDDDDNSNNQKFEPREDKQEEWTNDSPCKNKDKESNNNNDDDNDNEDLFVQLIAGSFGKRQGLQLVSDMGPFCHVIEL